MLFDPSLLWPSLAMFVGLILLAGFDFYANSPRPSGVALRSRQLAPILIIALSLTAALYSLKSLSATDMESLIAHGANFAPRSLNSERLRLFTYPMVITSPFESVVIALALVSTAILAAELGMLGIAILVLGITGGTALIANVVDQNALTHGPLEPCWGLFFCSVIFFWKNQRKLLEGVLRSLWEKKPRTARHRFKAILIPTVVVVSQLAGTLALTYLYRENIKLELILIALALTTLINLWFQLIRMFAGPHWESTSLFFISAVGGFVIAGFIVYFAPRGFDVIQWRSDALAIRAQIRDDLSAVVPPSSQAADASPVVPEQELKVAKRLSISTQRLRKLVDRAEPGPGPGALALSKSDQSAIEEMKLVGRMLAIVERLHRARALVADVDRHTHAGAVHSSEASKADALTVFWQDDRPSMDAELYSLQQLTQSGSESNSQRPLKAFLEGLNIDLERLTQAAFDVEIRRVDAWVDWAARQPRSELPSMKLVAVEQAAHLELLSTKARSMRLPADPRISTLHRNLRRMASVSSTANWE